ncbi:MFS family permease [Metabacillus malikii]|uniref:MFS family permease n=1 Tax=Metabacillus malikii TaxID=1504265 RepID=A0ABT9ZMA9_9BACI|nr:MFS family permease [Metabacillus malikii]
MYGSVFALLFTIVWVSMESLPIQIVISFILLTFAIPKIRIKLYQDSLKRKLKVAFYSSAVCFLLLYIYEWIFTKDGLAIDLAVLPSLVFIYLCIFLGVSVFGIPVSAFSDFVTEKAMFLRVYLAGVIHVGVGLLAYFIGLGVVIPLFCSAIFFIIDEITRYGKLKHMKV